jgi:hypothetical protein
MSAFKRRSLAILIVTAFLFGGAVPASFASNHMTNQEDETLGMVLDALLVRPLGIVAQAVGTVVFVVSLPFTALGGNVREAADKLVVAPAKFTWDRPLGHFEDYE